MMCKRYCERNASVVNCANCPDLALKFMGEVSSAIIH